MSDRAPDERCSFEKTICWNLFHLLFCLISALCCFLPIVLQMPSNLESRPLLHSLLSSAEFTYTCVAQIALLVPPIIDLILDILTESLNVSSNLNKKLKPPSAEPNRFNFLTLQERTLMLIGFVLLSMVGFFPKHTSNLALLYVCIYRCQQIRIGGTVILSLCRYNKEYWSIRSTLISLVFYSLGLVASPFLENIIAGQIDPSRMLMTLDLLKQLCIAIPCINSMWNSVRWLILVYCRAHSWKRFLMCTSNKSPIVEEPSSPEKDPADPHTFFAMVYTLSAMISCAITLVLLVTAMPRLENYSGLNLWLANIPSMIFVIMMSTLSMRMMKFEVVQGLVSTTVRCNSQCIHGWSPPLTI